MNRDFGLRAEPWLPELTLPAIERTLEHTGIRRVVVPAVAAAAGRILLLGDDPRIVSSPGGWLVRSDSPHFESTRIRPRVIKSRESERALSRLAEQGVQITCRVALRNARNVADHPGVQPRTAWGDPCEGVACVAHPDVRAALRAVLRELARLNPVGFEIADWVLDRFPSGESSLLSWHPAAARWLEICFCDSCRQLALDGGADPDAAARSVRVEFQRAIAAEVVESPPAIEDPVIRDYCAVRAAANSRWLESLAEDCGRARRLSETTTDGAAPPGWEALVDPVPASQWTRDADDVEATLERVLAARPPPRAIVLPCWRPWIRESAALIRLLAAAIDAGVTYFDFANTVSSPPEAGEWLERAVRFARRR